MVTEQGTPMRVGRKFKKLVEKVRESFKKAISETIGNKLTYEELTNIIAEKIEKAKIEFKFL